MITKGEFLGIGVVSVFGIGRIAVVLIGVCPMT